MEKSKLIIIFLSVVLMLVGTKLCMDSISLKESYEETFQTILNPLTTTVEYLSISPLAASNYMESFNTEEYIETSTNQIFISTWEAIKYRLSLPLGITSLIGGLTALLFRENIGGFLTNSFKYLV